jgi:CheY-like chemotaxis protein
MPTGHKKGKSVSGDQTKSAPGNGQLAHDMRNFLAPINNAVQVLKIRGLKDKDLLALAEIIERQIAGMRRLIDGLGSAPAAGSHAAAAAPVLPAATAEAAKRVLIVDDNAAFRVSLGGVLEDMGHAAKAAADGAEALQIAHGWTPQVVFLDVNMPGLNGYELARRFRSEFPGSDMKLIMLSGDTLNEATMRGAQNAGFDLCMDKLSNTQMFREVLA